MVWLPVSDASTKIRVVFFANNIDESTKHSGRPMYDDGTGMGERRDMGKVGELRAAALLNGDRTGAVHPRRFLPSSFSYPRSISRHRTKFQKKEKEKALPTYLTYLSTKRNIYTIYIYTPRASPNPKPRRAESSRAGRGPRRARDEMT